MKRFKLNEIIFIDDDPIVMLLGSKILDRIGYPGEVSMFFSGIEALEGLKLKLHSIQFEVLQFPILILLDINMPLMDGWGFLEVFQELPQEQKDHFKVVIVSSSLNPEDHARAKSCQDLIGYIQKPLDAEGFLEFLKNNELFDSSQT
ncbi:MAG: response regulator [Algoriphagus sp.]|uniref:response regulator n=1 Tax=Algoriphagus sp. TaxID=1872435 RepID=UPI0027336699|nr:response regulator [Algoriphagus sp.]MDP3471321.1 response regulator [Algoriphagus sp.]